MPDSPAGLGRLTNHQEDWTTARHLFESLLLLLLLENPHDGRCEFVTNRAGLDFVDAAGVTAPSLAPCTIRASNRNPQPGMRVVNAPQSYSHGAATGGFEADVEVAV